MQLSIEKEKGGTKVKVRSVYKRSHAHKMKNHELYLHDLGTTNAAVIDYAVERIQFRFQHLCSVCHLLCSK